MCFNKAKKNQSPLEMKRTPDFLKRDMLLVGLPSAWADQNNWLVHVFLWCFFVRGLRLCGLRKQKALRCNQHSQEAQTWWKKKTGMCHCHWQKEEKDKSTTVVSVVNERGPWSPLIVISYLTCDRSRTHVVLSSLCGSFPGKTKSRQSFSSGLGVGRCMSKN